LDSRRLLGGSAAGAARTEPKLRVDGPFNVVSLQIARQRRAIDELGSRTKKGAGDCGNAMNVSDHTTRVFDADLITLTQLVAQMGGLAQKQVTDSIDALSRRDMGLARQVIAADETVDGLQRQIEEKAVATIALRQPMAVDLRALVAMLRIANDLERIGDLAKNIGKRVIAVNGENSPVTLIRGLRHMATLVVSQLAAVLDAFVDRNPRKALRVWQGDKEVDALYVSLFRELLTYTMEDPGTISMCIHHLFCAKNIERIGDHATNIAEAVYFMAEGRTIAGERPKADTSSYAAEIYAAAKVPA
jgi:phosphate transport system protein